MKKIKTNSTNTILVTGAAGHIGNVLVRGLIRRGECVRALILPGEDTSALDGLDVEQVLGNVLDPPTLNKAMQRVDCVFHLAGIISILPEKDGLMYRVNVQGTRNVLQAARQNKVKRLVHISSIHALSRHWQGVIDERVPFDPDNAAGEYDRTKALASLEVIRAVKDGLNAVIVCPTGVIGPHDYRNSEVGDLLRQWIQPKPHVLIEGAYDFVDVRDVAQGLILAWLHGRRGEVYILSGQQIRLIKMKELVQQVTGVSTPTIRIPCWLAKIGARFSPLYYRLTRQTPKFTAYSVDTVLSNSRISSAKARRELGYTARPLLQTLRDTTRWLLKRDQVNISRS
jgi:dihydroflavonol-4-reductase